MISPCARCEPRPRPSPHWGICRARSNASRAPAPASVSRVSYEIHGEFEVDVSAKGIGFFGLITQSATAGVQFPNTLSIDWFTGPGGSPLPPGVVVRLPAAGGLVLADTTLHLEVVSRSGNTAVLRVTGAPGRIHRLESSEKLDEWTPLGDDFTPESRSILKTVDLPGGPAAFLRLACE